MPTYRNISVSLVSQFDILTIPEYAPPSAPNLLEVPSSPSKATSQSNVPLPSLRGDDHVVSVYIPSYPSSQFWVTYRIDPPAAGTELSGIEYYFKLFLNKTHLVSWGCGAQDGFKGKTMFGIFRAEGHGKAMRKIFCFGGERDLWAGRAELNDVLEIRVYRAGGRKQIRPTMLESRVQLEAIDKKPMNRGGVILTRAGPVRINHPVNFFNFLLIDPLDEPYATFRYLCRSWDTLEGLGVTTPLATPMPSQPSTPVKGFVQRNTEMFDTEDCLYIHQRILEVKARGVPQPKLKPEPLRFKKVSENPSSPSAIKADDGLPSGLRCLDPKKPRSDEKSPQSPKTRPQDLSKALPTRPGTPTSNPDETPSPSPIRIPLSFSQPLYRSILPPKLVLLPPSQVSNSTRPSPTKSSFSENVASLFHPTPKEDVILSSKSHPVKVSDTDANTYGTSPTVTTPERNFPLTTMHSGPGHAVATPPLLLSSVRDLAEKPDGEALSAPSKPSPSLTAVQPVEKEEKPKLKPVSSPPPRTSSPKLGKRRAGQYASTSNIRPASSEGSGSTPPHRRPSLPNVSSRDRSPVPHPIRSSSVNTTGTPINFLSSSSSSTATLSPNMERKERKGFLSNIVQSAKRRHLGGHGIVNAEVKSERGIINGFGNGGWPAAQAVTDSLDGDSGKMMLDRRNGDGFGANEGENAEDKPGAIPEGW
ncbi:hypothetical protein MMC25_000752 [Agyrium rufum]|nr:hypothetical protein [Agyrium rufum]